MKRASVRANACRAIGHMPAAGNARPSDGLRGMRRPRAIVGQGRLVAFLQGLASQSSKPCAHGSGSQSPLRTNARRLCVALPEPITRMPSSRNDASLRPSAI